MQNAWIWIVVIVIILVGGFLWWQSSQPSTGVTIQTPTTDTTDTNTITPTPASTSTETQTSTSTAAGPVTVTYDGNSFTPSTVTVQKGESVTFVDSNGTMWVASSPHPAHTGYDGTSRSTHCAPGYTGPTPFDQCSPGASYSFTFDKTGTWSYHDHLNASASGKVVVQ